MSQRNDTVESIFISFTNKAKNQTLYIINNLPPPETLNMSKILAIVKCAGTTPFKSVTLAIQLIRAICISKLQSHHDSNFCDNCQVNMAELLHDKIIGNYAPAFTEYHKDIIEDFHKMICILENTQSPDIKSTKFHNSGIGTAALKCKRHDDDDELMALINRQIIDYVLLPLLTYIVGSVPFQVYSNVDLNRIYFELKENEPGAIITAIPDQPDFAVNRNYDFQPLCRILSLMNNAFLLSSNNNTLNITQKLNDLHGLSIPDVAYFTSQNAVQNRIDLVAEFMFVVMDKLLSRTAIATFIADSISRTFNGARNLMMQKHESQFLKTNIVDAQIGISMAAQIKQIERIAWS